MSPDYYHVGSEDNEKEMKTVPGPEGLAIHSGMLMLLVKEKSASN